jgi:hypothetical protein
VVLRPVRFIPENVQATPSGSFSSTLLPHPWRCEDREVLGVANLLAGFDVDKCDHRTTSYVWPCWWTSHLGLACRHLNKKQPQSSFNNWGRHSNAPSQSGDGSLAPVATRLSHLQFLFPSSEGEAAVFAIEQITSPEKMNVARCNARFSGFSWRSSRSWRWSFSCCTSYSDRRTRALADLARGQRCQSRA